MYKRQYLPPALLAEWLGSFTCYCGNTRVERILNKSTQICFWRRKFSRRSCRDSNSQPFDHVSGALTNNLSRLPISQYFKDHERQLSLIESPVGRPVLAMTSLSSVRFPLSRHILCVERGGEEVVALFLLCLDGGFFVSPIPPIILLFSRRREQC